MSGKNSQIHKNSCVLLIFVCAKVSVVNCRKSLKLSKQQIKYIYIYILSAGLLNGQSLSKLTRRGAQLNFGYDSVFFFLGLALRVHPRKSSLQKVYKSVAETLQIVSS